MPMDPFTDPERAAALAQLADTAADLATTAARLTQRSTELMKLHDRIKQDAPIITGAPPPDPTPPPPVTLGETFESAVYDISGPPFISGTRRGLNEGVLHDVGDWTNWKPGSRPGSGLRNGNELNAWWTVSQRLNARIERGCYLQVKAYRWYVLLESTRQWRELYRDELTRDGQFIDARVRWQYITDFDNTPGTLRQATAAEGGGSLILLDKLLEPNVSVIHGWNGGNQRIEMSQFGAVRAPHISMLMRLAGPLAKKASDGDWFLAVGTGDRFNNTVYEADIGYPRHKFVRDYWQAFTCTAGTELVADRDQPDVLAAILRGHPNWPKNTVG